MHKCKLALVPWVSQVHPYEAAYISRQQHGGPGLDRLRKMVVMLVLLPQLISLNPACQRLLYRLAGGGITVRESDWSKVAWRQDRFDGCIGIIAGGFLAATMPVTSFVSGRVPKRSSP